MIRAIRSISWPRWMTFIVSLVGAALTIGFYIHELQVPGNRISFGYLFFISLPFVFGAAMSVWPMHKRIRIILFWLTALFIGFGGALSLFGGFGIYNVFTVIVFLVAAWFENESGIPSSRRSRNVTTNPRDIAHRPR